MAGAQQNMFLNDGGSGVSPRTNMFDPEGSSPSFAGNQHATYPGLPQTNPSPGMLPQVNAQGYTPFTYANPPVSPYTSDLGGGNKALSTMSPAFTQNFLNFLSSQMGKGASPYGGSLSAGYNPLLASLSSFLRGGQSDNPALQSLSDISRGGGPGGDVLGGISRGEGPGGDILGMISRGQGTSGETLSDIAKGNDPGMAALRSIAQGTGLGQDTLATIAESGLPIDQTPAWKAMVEASQRQIGQREAQLKEQFSSTGNLVGSPYGSAVSDFESQTSKDLNAQLISAQTAGLESAAGRRLSASEALGQEQLSAGTALPQIRAGAAGTLGAQQTGAASTLAGNALSAGGALQSNALQAGGQILGASENTSQFLQNLDQSSLDRLYQEFMRTQPEYNPLLQMMYGSAFTFPPVLGKNTSIGAGGALLANAGNIASGVGDIIGASKGKPKGT